MQREALLDEDALRDLIELGKQSQPGQDYVRNKLPCVAASLSHSLPEALQAARRHRAQITRFETVDKLLATSVDLAELSTDD